MSPGVGYAAAKRVLHMYVTGTDIPWQAHQTCALGWYLNIAFESNLSQSQPLQNIIATLMVLPVLFCKPRPNHKPQECQQRSSKLIKLLLSCYAAEHWLDWFVVFAYRQQMPESDSPQQHAASCHGGAELHNLQQPIPCFVT
jgi:hypothetical protein